MEKKLSDNEIVGILKKWKENLVLRREERTDFLKKFNLLPKDNAIINSLIDQGYYFLV